MTTYNTTRENEQLRYLKADIASFIQRYESKPTTARRRTLFLFPGGMASQLLRARTPYQDNGTPQKFQYDNYWLSLLTFLGGALYLGMYKRGNVFHDCDDRIVIPYGAVNLCGLTPYDRFTQWCEANDLDWFIFGWDWRRRLDDTVSFFFKKFLPLFRSTVQQQCGVDPLQHFILVGHSFGGMVVKLMLHNQDPLLANMTQAVTVASPFYGYDSQIHRWFEGEPLLNWIGTNDVTMPMIKVITSLPGCYALPYLDHRTFVNNPGLQKDRNYPLRKYPSKESLTSNQNVDPFNPGPDRFPTDTGFDLNELGYALTTYRTIAGHPPYANKFFNIRGIQAPSGSTTGSIKWGILTGALNPLASPITSGPGVPGDGTQAAWTARLVTLNSNQVFRVKGNIDHMFIMEDDLTLAKVARALMGARRRGAMKNRSKLSPPPVQPAKQEKVYDFLKGLQKFCAKGEWVLEEDEVKKYDKAGVVAYLNKMSVGSQKAIARRIIMDILKSPTKGLPRRGDDARTKKRMMKKAKAKSKPANTEAKKRKSRPRR